MPLWLKIGWTVWLGIWIPVYWYHYGAQNFLYFCDLGNILVGVALWTESALIFSWQATGLLFFQSLYTIDLLSALLFHVHVIGGTEYMFDPGIPIGIRLLSLFHVVTPPLLLWAIWRLGYDTRGWKLQTLTCWIIVPINYFWRSTFNVNFARGLLREQHMVLGLVYLFVYLIVVPLLVYWPTHLILERWQVKHPRSQSTADPRSAEAGGVHAR